MKYSGVYFYHLVAEKSIKLPLIGIGNQTVNVILNTHRDIIETSCHLGFGSAEL